MDESNKDTLKIDEFQTVSSQPACGWESNEVWALAQPKEHNELKFSTCYILIRDRWCLGSWHAILLSSKKKAIDLFLSSFCWGKKRLCPQS